MRKVTINSIRRFERFERFNSGNTKVTIDGEGTAHLKLHNNTIAKKRCDGSVYVSNCGWFTRTTKERLNGIRAVRIRQKDYEWHLNDKNWNGEMVKVR